VRIRSQGRSWPRLCFSRSPGTEIENASSGSMPFPPPTREWMPIWVGDVGAWLTVAEQRRGSSGGGRLLTHGRLREPAPRLRSGQAEGLPYEGTRGALESRGRGGIDVALIVLSYGGLHEARPQAPIPVVGLVRAHCRAPTESGSGPFGPAQVKQEWAGGAQRPRASPFGSAQGKPKPAPNGRRSGDPSKVAGGD